MLLDSLYKEVVKLDEEGGGSQTGRGDGSDDKGNIGDDEWQQRRWQRRRWLQRLMSVAAMTTATVT